MTDGNTYAINKHLDALQEVWGALQEFTAELEQAEARIEELESKLAKAVVFAEIVERAGHGALWPLALDILAELKGQDDDAT